MSGSSEGVFDNQPTGGADGMSRAVRLAVHQMIDTS
jgi:hypothetical protein